MADDHKLILASRVEHTPVFDEEGSLIGHVRDLSIDRTSGQVVYAILSFGGFLGIGKRLHPLPWDILSYNEKQHGYVVGLGKADLASAPHYDADELEGFGGEQHARKHRDIFEYYGTFGPPPI
ncbi:PRC-barrel domain containing protein [Croceicoccus ponticola]|uniref:PRC-barrel domain containing protein n=1 Tax=Croceicoccus ponticola TaxID=2217664 RepID=A0A437H043_9SPHN|nr:PRC-barrel domain-containing protein [Croceicoccus ponticola]RVQ68981.1 PRC-barrel domain containing protein [Croceicoccus ponticola]